MELKLPTLEQLRLVYDRDLLEAFPKAELKPLANMEKMWAEGWYKPYCLFDGEDILGEAFLWLGHPGWGLLDYLCVSPRARNGGLGALILEKMLEREEGAVILGETEAPVHAPDPEMARRRLGFYRRNGVKMAGYDTEIFGAHYHTFYWADREVEDRRLEAEHRFIYQSRFTPSQYARHIHIPRDPNAGPPVQVAWEE